MANGLQIFDSGSKKQLDTASRVARLHSNYFFATINSGQTIIQSVPGMTTDGTWFAIWNSTVVDVRIGIGQFTAKNTTVTGNNPLGANTEVVIFRL